MVRMRTQVPFVPYFLPLSLPPFSFSFSLSFSALFLGTSFSLCLYLLFSPVYLFSTV